MAKKTIQSQNLSGVGNSIEHQYIISDLIFGVRKKLSKNKKWNKCFALSEISLSSLGYDANDFTHNHNIDFVVIDENKDVKVLIEIQKKGIDIKKNRSKIEECVEKIDTIEDAFLIRFDKEGKIYFDRYDGEWEENISSKSKFLVTI